MSCFYFCFFLLIFVFKVLGSPEKNFVDIGQARTKIALAKSCIGYRKLSDKNVTKECHYQGWENPKR